MFKAIKVVLPVAVLLAMLTSSKQGCLANVLVSMCGHLMQTGLGKPKLPSAIYISK